MPLRGLCAVTLDDLLLPRLSALVGAALDGGAPFVQYRNKIAPRPCAVPRRPRCCASVVPPAPG
jgi:hypothetical protein